jgi:hypothetical protein
MVRGIISGVSFVAYPNLPSAKEVCERRRHAHDTLVTGTDLLERSVVETLGNVGGLLLDGNKDVAGLVVEALVGVVVTDLLDRVSDDRLVVDLGSGRDLTEDLRVNSDSFLQGSGRLTMIIPVLVAVSQATLENGSCRQ